MKSEDVEINKVSDGYQVQIALDDDKYKYRHYKTLAGAEKYRKKMITWGGSREAGPGKKLGRPVRSDKKKKVSFSLSSEAITALDDLLLIHGTSNTSKSQIIEKLLLES